MPPSGIRAARVRRRTNKCDRAMNQKTYSHLESLKRMPTEYEIATSQLHYYIGRGFEVDLPLKEWFRQYQDGSPLTCSSWEIFADPRETTYTKYMSLQSS